MKIVTGRFAEARGYLQYVLALLYPGREVPVYQQPMERQTDLEHLNDEDYALLIEEGRRQLDRQAADLQRNHTRAATLLTVAVAELVFLIRSREAVFDHGVTVIVPWVLSVALAVLALTGTISVLTSRAVYGHVSTVANADGPSPVLPHLARAYTDAVGIGEVTNAARLTVLRDAVWLAALSAVVLLMITPFTATSTEASKRGTPEPAQAPTATSNPTTTTSPPSPSWSPSTTANPSNPTTARP